MLFHKCLTDEQLEVLLYAANNGTFICGPGKEEFEAVCSLVLTGQLHRGEAPPDHPDWAYFSLTKKGHAEMVCNSMKEIYNRESLHSNLDAHIKAAELDCSQLCMSEKIIHRS